MLLRAFLKRFTLTKMTLYIDKINDYIKNLDNKTFNALHSISKEKIYKKGELLLRQDEVCTKSYLMISGIARKYYLNDGKEIITELFLKMI